MLRAYSFCLVCLGFFVAACGGSDTSDPDGSGGSGGSAGSGATGGGAGSGGKAGGAGSGGSAGSSGASGSGGGAGQGGSGGGIACGKALTCSGAEVCVEVTYEPGNCTPLGDPNGKCPTDKFQTFCGGAGGVCCCDPPPPTTYSCNPGSGCAGAVTCQCITCPDSKMCTPVGSETSGVFRCEEPPKP